MAAAVARKVSRRESNEEKARSTLVRKFLEQVFEGGWGVAVCVSRLISLVSVGGGKEVRTYKSAEHEMVVMSHGGVVEERGRVCVARILDDQVLRFGTFIASSYKPSERLFSWYSQSSRKSDQQSIHSAFGPRSLGIGSMPCQSHRVTSSAQCHLWQISRHGRVEAQNVDIGAASLGQIPNVSKI